MINNFADTVKYRNAVESNMSSRKVSGSVFCIKFCLDFITQEHKKISDVIMMLPLHVMMLPLHIMILLLHINKIPVHII